MNQTKKSAFYKNFIQEDIYHLDTPRQKNNQEFKEQTNKIGFVHDSEATNEELALLNRIIEACKLPEESFEVVSLVNFKEKIFKKSVIFSTKESTKDYNTLQNEEERLTVYTYPLKALLTMQEERKQLWFVLKQLLTSN